MQNELQHSAKGSHWQKKNHKYIAIENGRYIYPDVVGGAGKHHKTKSTFTLSKKKREQQAKVAETQARLDAEHRRLNTINKLDSTAERCGSADTSFLSAWMPCFRRCRIRRRAG